MKGFTNHKRRIRNPIVCSSADNKAELRVTLSPKSFMAPLLRQPRYSFHLKIDYFPLIYIGSDSLMFN